ncbi:hypothetical protein EDB89DRAFT_1537874 [Lactarius sanguifluus]|nr:hypothetical protein EDB89DRAFT_1537874 [Lactarius sanguifluus]
MFTPALPLRHFPGPKLAACSRLWLAYRELVRGGSLGDLHVELHRQCGAPKSYKLSVPMIYFLFLGEIVRLAPNGLLFSNPAVYNDGCNHREQVGQGSHALPRLRLGYVHYSDANTLEMSLPQSSPGYLSSKCRTS